MAKDKLFEQVTGFTNLNTLDKSPNTGKTELSSLINMYHTTNGAIENRLGSETFKNNSQWGDVPVIEGKGYSYGYGPSKVGVVLEDGRFFYINVEDYSSNPRIFLEPNKSWVEVNGVGGGNLLNVVNRNEVFWEVINRHSYFCDGGNQIKYFGEDGITHTVEDPVGFEIELDVDSSVSVTLDSEYMDSSDNSRRYFVSSDKTSGVGSKIIVRQLLGDGRLPSSGSLELDVGPSGDTSTINYSNVSYSDNFVCLGQHKGCLVAISNIGRVWISTPNAGMDMTGPQVERLEYGIEDGLKISNAFPFSRGVLLNLSNSELEKAACSSLTGYYRPDPNSTINQNSDDYYKIVRESKRIAFYGRSGQEVDNGIMGLTREGFILADSQQSVREFGLNNRINISPKIKDIVRKLNFKYIDDVRTTIDEQNSRYLCSIPTRESRGNTVVLAYDFGKSTRSSANRSAIDKWSIFLYNIGSRHITSIFTIFGVPFLGLSDGTVVQTEMEDIYKDMGEVYESSFSTKGYDFGLRHKYKVLESGLFDLTLTEKMRLAIYPVIDSYPILKDYDGKTNSNKLITPKDLSSLDVWTDEESDKWTDNPLDVWGGLGQSDYSYVIAKSIPKFRDISFVIKDLTGGKRWGSFGLELVAVVADNYFDGRFRENIEVDNDESTDMLI